MKAGIFVRVGQIVLFLLCHFALPCPGVAHGVFDVGFSCPSEHFIRLLWLCPNLLDVAGPAWTDLVGNGHSRGLFKCVDKLKHGKSATRAEIEYLNGVGVRIFKHALHGYDVGLGQVHNVDIVADAAAVGGVVVVAEYGQLLADS